MRTLLTLTLSLMLAVPALGAPAAAGSSSAKPISAPPASASLLAGALSGGHTAAPLALPASNGLLPGAMPSRHAASTTEGSSATSFHLLNRARDAGMLVADGSALQNTCDEATRVGLASAAEFDTTGWLLGGVFLGIIMPIVSHVMDAPAPPAARMRAISDSDVRECFVSAYSEQVKSSRTRSAWIGVLANVGLVTAGIIVTR